MLQFPYLWHYYTQGVLRQYLQMLYHWASTLQIHIQEEYMCLNEMQLALPQASYMSQNLKMPKCPSAKHASIKPQRVHAM